MSGVWLKYCIRSTSLNTQTIEEVVPGVITCQAAQEIIARRYGVRKEEVVIFSFRSA